MPLHAEMIPVSNFKEDANATSNIISLIYVSLHQSTSKNIGVLMPAESQGKKQTDST